MDKKRKTALSLALPLALTPTFPAMASIVGNAGAGFLCAMLGIYLNYFILDNAVALAKKGEL